jgi:hypothetical protein
VEENDLRQELEATLHARQEVGAELEPQLVARFVDRIDAEIDRRSSERYAQRRPMSRVNPGVALGSLGLAIPLIAIAGNFAGFGGVLLICLAIVFVNLFYYSSHR